MTTEQVASLGGRFAQFLAEFACCFGRPTFEHFLTYCRGLLGLLPRKCVERIALAAGAAVRTMQEFLTHLDWDQDRMRDLIQHRIAQNHAPVPGQPRRPNDLGTVGIIDETGHPKKGDKTPGVQRQYCGASGKVDNCIVTVHLGYTWESFEALIDRDLYLPKSWDQDPDRCQDAHIPEDLTYRPKWQIAQEQIHRAMANGIHFDWLTFDEEYGKVPAFLFHLDAMGQTYVAEVPSNFHAWVRRPKYRSLRKEFAPREVRNLARWSDPFIYPPWQTVTIERRTREPRIWKVKSAPVYLPKGPGPRRVPTDRTYHLIHAWQPETDEHKYYISNAPTSTPVTTLLRVAFERARIEHLFRVAKNEVGLDHFEGRSYLGLMRHQTLCLLVLLFLAEQTTRLRGEKSAGDDGAVRRRLEYVVSALAPAAASPVAV